MQIKGIILIIGISIIGILADFDIIQRSHSDFYDITLIYKTHLQYNGNECKPNISSNGSIRFECYNVEIHLKTNAVGMPLEYNGVILRSDDKSLEFIADKKYPNDIFTNNVIEYNSNKWSIKTFSMNDLPTTTYNMLTWMHNGYSKEETFKIKWKQKNTIKTCISISYIHQKPLGYEVSVEILNLNNTTKYVLNSNILQPTEELTTVLIKSSNLLLENDTYSLNLNINWNEQHYRFRYIYSDSCIIGIKRIAQCTDKYQNEELYTMSVDEHELTSNAEQAFGVYPFGNTLLLSKQRSSSKCLNGGFLYNNTCMCHPGFKGNACEYACGPNTFGVDCSGMCSIHRTGCQKMIFCTKSFGCECPSGFTGINCETKCTNGTYGVNCAQRCSESCNSDICDIYTGSCTEGCKQNYISPDCVEKYPWLNQPPTLESLDFHSIKLKLNFHSKYINGSETIIPTYYQIIYKLANETDYTYTELKEIDQNKSVIETVDNLKPETSYSFGVLIVSGDGNYNFEDIVTVNYTTLCRLKEHIDYGVHLLSDIDHINVTWNTRNNQNEDECKITGYMLKLMVDDTDQEHKSHLEVVKFIKNNNNNNNNNTFTFDNLLSGRKYAVQIKAISTIRESEISPSEISSISTRPYGFVKIENIKAELFNNQSAIKVTWDTDDITMTYIVKYKINKYFSCSHETVKSDWTSLLVYNQTKCEIYDIIPNTQYIIQVVSTIEGHNYTDHENIIFVKTPKSTPTLTPVYVENSSYVTNQTAYFNWTINKNECSKLNGFFVGYSVVLKNVSKGTRTVQTTNQGTINYDGLDPDTKYELLVYVTTNYGYNTQQALSIPFQTKSKFLAPVEELTVYRKNLKRKSIGIRWSFLDDYNVNGYVIWAINDEIGFTKQITVEPEKCTAWPTYYCATFENLIPNNQYTIKIKAKSSDYPMGGSVASVVTNFNDGFSDKPENLKATYVSSTYITLEWDIPWIFNGVLKSFIINTEEISSKDIDKCCESKPDEEVQVTEEMPTYNHTIYNLMPGSTYSFGVLSKTTLYGQTNRIHVTTLSGIDDIHSLNNSVTEPSIASI